LFLAFLADAEIRPRIANLLICQFVKRLSVCFRLQFFKHAKMLKTELKKMFQIVDIQDFERF